MGVLSGHVAEVIIEFFSVYWWYSQKLNMITCTSKDPYPGCLCGTGVMRRHNVSEVSDVSAGKNLNEQDVKGLRMLRGCLFDDLSVWELYVGMHVVLHFTWPLGAKSAGCPYPFSRQSKV